MGSQGFRNIAGNPFVYQEDTRSAAIGLDNTATTWKLVVSSTAGALPTDTAKVTIDPGVAGNITLTPNGSVAISTLALGLLKTNASGLISNLSVGSTGTILTGVTGADPTWTTATYPATVAIGDVLVASAANVVGVVTGAATSGYVLMANGAGTAPTFQTLPPSFTWSIKTADLNPIVVDNGYIANKAGVLTFTLPATCAVGKTFRITGMNTALGWKIAQNAGQQIFFGNAATTSGATGYLQSSATYDAVELVCNVVDTSWIVTSCIGNITVF
jgi:hypothetical protein